MKKYGTIILLGAIIAIVFLFFFRKENNTSYLYDRWVVAHIVYEGKELFNNDLEKNGFVVPMRDGALIEISKKDITYVPYKREITFLPDGTIKVTEREKPTTIKSKIFKRNDSLFIKMEHPSKDELNGEFFINKKEEEYRYVPPYPAKEIRLILTNKQTSIYLWKLEGDVEFHY